MARIPLFVMFGLVFVATPVWADPPSQDPIKYYYQLKKAPADVNAAGLVFGEKLRDVLVQPKLDSIAHMKIALVDILVTIHRIKEEISALQVIPSPAGRELHDAVENYLKQQEKTIFDSAPEIIRIAADSALSGNVKKAKIQEIIEQNRKGAALVEGPYNQAVLAFAREYGLVGEPKSELREFIPPDKSCKVQMPDLTENKTSENNGIKNSYFLAEHKHGLFMLSYADIATPGEEPDMLQKRLDEARTGVVNKLNMKVTKETPISLENKHPGREIEGELPDHTVTRIRLYMVNGRLYQLWTVGSPVWMASGEAMRFLKSFELAK